MLQGRKNRQMQQKSIKENSILNVIKTISSIIFPLITFPYISRVLLPNNVGKINFGTSFISYFSMIASLGITTYAIRECSAVREDKSKLGKKASEIFSINICTTFIAYVLLAVSLILFRKLDNYRVLIIIQSTTILFTTLGADWLNSAMEDFKYITIRTIAFQVISLLMMFCFVRTPDDYIKYAVISVFSSSGANIVNIFYRKRFCEVKFTNDMNWKIHFKPIFLLFVMIMAQTIFSSADQTMLGIMKGDYEVGIYSTALKIENIILQVVASLVWVVMPRLSIYFAEEDYKKINGMLKKTLSIFMVIGCPAIAGVWALSNEIVMIIGGKNFLDSALPLNILMLAFAFSLIGGSFLGNMVLLPSKKENVYMWICCITAVFNVVMNYILIPHGGASAAAFTTALSSLLILILLLLKKDKRIKLDYIVEVIISPLIGSVVIFVYCKIIEILFTGLWSRTIVSILGSIILYCLVMIMMKNDLCMELIEAIKTRIKRHSK